MVSREKVLRFKTKYSIADSHIRYIIREDGKTAVHLLDGRVVTTFLPIKSLIETMDEHCFLNINKGVWIAVQQVSQVAENTYIMSDGRRFHGRIRNKSLSHSDETEILSAIPTTTGSNAQHFMQRFAILDQMPVAFCIIELVFDQNGHGVDFIFRYCNNEMATLEHVPIEQMLHHSFYEIFPNGDKKWLITYADVALNGTTRIIRDFSSEANRSLTIYCFQPEPGYCACLLIDNNAFLATPPH